MRVLIWLTLLVGALESSGCYHRWTRNAPGHVDLQSPPSDPSLTESEEPRDPGDQALIFSAGGFASAGAAFGDGRGIRGSDHLGFELNALYGVFDQTASDRILAFLGPRILDRALGVNFGWIPHVDDSQRSRLFVEVEAILLRARGLALGWAWEPNGAGYGPQLTVFFGSFFFRSSYLTSHGTTMHFGLLLSLSQMMIWSR